MECAPQIEDDESARLGIERLYFATRASDDLKANSGERSFEERVAGRVHDRAVCAMIQGKLWFVELNGRPWGSMALSRRQGLEYPAWHVRLAMDEHSPVGLDVIAPAPGVVCRHVGPRVHARPVRAARREVEGSDAMAVVLENDGQCVRVFTETTAYYNWRRDDRKVFIADCYYTIHDNLFKSRS